MAKYIYLMDDIRIQYLQEANPNHVYKLDELSEKQKEVASSLSCLQNDEYFYYYNVTRDVKPSPFPNGSELLISCLDDLWKCYRDYHARSTLEPGKFSPPFTER